MRAPLLRHAVSHGEALTQRLRRSFPMISRILAATVGGYAVTSLLTLALPLILAALGIDQAQALLGATTGSFLLWTAIIMAVFHARSALRAWTVLAVAAAPLIVIVFTLLPGAHP